MAERWGAPLEGGAAPKVALRSLFLGYEEEPVPSFLAAMAEVEKAGTLPHVMKRAELTYKMAQEHKQPGGCLHNSPLDVDSIAALMKYTEEVPPFKGRPQPQLYSALNAACYDSDRTQVMPFCDFIWLLVKSMEKLPPFPPEVVFRGVKGVNHRDDPKYQEGRMVTWHGFVSATKQLKLVNDFLGKEGIRTLFNIKLTQGQARDISGYSVIPGENEVLHPPCCSFVVKSVLDQGELTIIDMEESPSQLYILNISAPLASPASPEDLRRSRAEVLQAPATSAAACAEREGAKVVLKDKFAGGIALTFSGGLVQEGGKIMKKEDTLERWNAGGLCNVPKIEAGKRLGVRFQPCQNDMSVMLGLQHCVGLPSPPHHMGELEIAVHCAKDGTLEIFSQGDRVAQCGKYRPSSIVELSVNEASEVGLFMDGKFLFRHATPPRFPLYMAASFFTPGAAIRGLSWTEGTPFEGEPAPPPAPPGPRGPVNFVVRNGLQQMQPGHLRKTGGAVNWIDTAVSSESIVVGQGRGLRFRPGPSTGADYYMIGLGGTGSCPADCNGIDYAAYNWNGTFWVFESGAQKLRDGGPLSGTSVVELRVSETQVEYRVDGVLKYTGQLRGQRQLYAMASFCNPVGSEALEIQWL